MLNDQLTDAGILAQTLQNAFHFVTGILEGSLPGVFLITGHIVGGMVAGHDHQGQQNNLLGAGLLYQSENIIQRGIGFHGADEVIGVTGFGQLFLQVCVSSICLVMSTVTHVNDGSALLVILSGLFDQRSDQSIVVSRLGQHRCTDLEAVELVGIQGDLCDHIVIFRTGHHMSGLNHNFLDAVHDHAGHCLGHVVDLQALALFQNVNDRLSGKGTAHFVLGIGSLQSFLNRADGDVAGLVIAAAKADRQNDGLLAVVFFHRGLRSFRSIGNIRSGFTDRGLRLLGTRLLGSTADHAQNQAKSQHQRNDSFHDFHFSFLQMIKFVYFLG